MPTEDGMKSVMQQYIDGFNKKDAKVLYSLFADNARIEDPVGGDKIVEGITAIEEFYKGAVTMVDKLELSAPVRASHGSEAAMAFTIYMQADDKPVQIHVIDVMTFDDSGKIIDIKAYHGKTDIAH